MRLHGDVSIEMVQSTVSLLAAVPSTLVHALDLLITTSGAFVLLCARNRNEGINLRKVLLEISCPTMEIECC